MFLLTDGEVGQSERAQIVDYTKTQHESRVHTFGIGRECDRQLIKETAQAGRGTASFADDNTELTQNVVNALRKAFEPSL